MTRPTVIELDAIIKKSGLAIPEDSWLHSEDFAFLVKKKSLLSLGLEKKEGPDCKVRHHKVELDDLEFVIVQRETEGEVSWFLILPETEWSAKRVHFKGFYEEVKALNQMGREAGVRISLTDIVARVPDFVVQEHLPEALGVVGFQDVETKDLFALYLAKEQQ